MTPWRNFERAAPEFAQSVRALFVAHRHKTVATLRADGSQRISGIEAVFEGGELVFGRDPGSHRTPPARVGIPIADHSRALPLNSHDYDRDSPMNTFITELRNTIIPDMTGRHGPLPSLLLGMTVVTGLVDAFSYLVLGHVFVANMTGNIVLVGFAFAGAAGFSIPASLAAVAAFSLGALLGGRLGAALGQHRGRLLNVAAGLQVLLLLIASLLAIISASPVSSGYRYPLIISLGAAMGIQNATARKLAVPDLTTTVLTLTITGIAADSAIAGGKGSVAGRRLAAVAAMLIGALLGATFIVHVNIAYPLILALIGMIGVAAASRPLARSDAAWTRP